MLIQNKMVKTVSTLSEYNAVIAQVDGLRKNFLFNFSRILMNLFQDMLVCVDFSATWCPPCRMIAPILEEMSKEFEGKVAFLKVRIISKLFINYLFIFEIYVF